MAIYPCSIIRGGTSKGVFLLDENLPQDPTQRDRVLLALMGSPDARQVDGLGGGDPLTSKVVIVSRATRPDCDVEYESIEVAVGESFVNHGIMCGNLAAGVSYYAMAEGLLSTRAASSGVRMFCRSNGKMIVCKLPSSLTRPTATGGSAQLEELHGANSAVSLTFEDPAGAVTGKLLPTGEPLSTVALEDGRSIEASVVDSGTLYAFVRATEFGVTGNESATALDTHAPFRAAIESARTRITQLINDRMCGTAPLSPRRLKMAIVAQSDRCDQGVDLMARVINPAKVHKAYAVSGAISLGSAATIPGTVVNELVGHAAAAPLMLRIGHPTGVLSVVIHHSRGESRCHIEGAEIQRTVRVLMRGNAYLPDEVTTQ